jgi:hypothetical protein
LAVGNREIRILNSENKSPLSLQVWRRANRLRLNAIALENVGHRSFRDENSPSGCRKSPRGSLDGDEFFGDTVANE